MKILLPLLLAASAFAQIANTQDVGNVSMLSVETADDLTVFVKTKTCDAVGVEISVVLANPAPGEKRILTESRTFAGCGTLRPVRVTFATNGRIVSEIRISEVTRISTQVARPAPVT